MSIDTVRKYFEPLGMSHKIQEFSVSSATVELAAQALDTKPCRIAKTLSFRGPDGCILVVAAGDTKVDNAKFKTTFGVKAKMLSPDEVLAQTSHPVGGVCPFAVPQGVRVCLDISMKRFDTIFPACGTANSAIELTMPDLEIAAQSTDWVDVCKIF